MSNKEKQTLVQRGHAAIEKVHEELTKAGIESTFRTSHGGGLGSAKVTGTMLGVYVQEGQRRDGWGGNGKLYIKVHTGPHQRDYSLIEGKNGFNFQKLVDAVKSRIVQEVEEREKARKEHAVYKKAQAVADRINKNLVDTSFGTPRAYVKNNGDLSMRIGLITEDEVRAAITAILEVRKRK